MPLCDTLLRAAEAKLYKLHFSQEILDGATRNLIKNEVMSEAKAAYFEAQIKTSFPKSLVEVPAQLIAAMTNDPNDRHVVAAAVMANAKIIVTDNIDDFPAEALETWGIEVLHPDDFLVELDEQHSGKLIEILREQSEKLKNPPITILDLLDKLEKNNRVIKFARSIRCQLHAEEIVITAIKTLNKIGIAAPEGGICFEGKRYRLWRNKEVLTITAKDNRGEILRFENGGVGGYLSSDDIKAFQVFAQNLESFEVK
jgi:predicted nucleic acid-binding protein